MKWLIVILVAMLLFGCATPAPQHAMCPRDLFDYFPSGAKSESEWWIGSCCNHILKGCAI